MRLEKAISLFPGSSLRRFASYPDCLFRHAERSRSISRRDLFAA
jgi:hypothetical protein